MLLKLPLTGGIIFEVCSYWFLNQCFVRQLRAVCNPRNHVGKYTLHFAGATIETESEFVEMRAVHFRSLAHSHLPNDHNTLFRVGRAKMKSLELGNIFPNQPDTIVRPLWVSLTIPPCIVCQRR